MRILPTITPRIARINPAQIITPTETPLIGTVALKPRKNMPRTTGIRLITVTLSETLYACLCDVIHGLRM